MAKEDILYNFINNEWRKSAATEYADVTNPATLEVIARVPMSPGSDVELAVQAAQKALETWKYVPVGERIQPLFRLKGLLEQNFEDLARTITMECGKTLEESRGEVRRVIENVEIACGMPVMMQGYLTEDVAPGIDEFMIRQPVGVCAVINPFNFPAMIAFWFLPYAIACGNTYIVKPSTKVPVTLQKIFQLFEKVGLPKGIVNLVNGSGPVADAILDHPAIRAVSFVGSTEVAKYIYSRSTANGKRAQCQGGAKNPVVIMPDADMETTTKIVADSAFGCAGQRCAAVSTAITIGEARDVFADAISEAAATRTTGYGLNEGIQMGPVISGKDKKRIEETVTRGIQEGAEIRVDGRNAKIAGYESGFFIKPTVMMDIKPDGEIAKTEIFGPVIGLMHINTLEEAISYINKSNYGNMACIFTSSGASARKFRREVEAGDIGVNIGIAAPMANFPFSGWKDSFFGDLHAQGMDAVEFFTQKKVVVERWPKQWSRKF